MAAAEATALRFEEIEKVYRPGWRRRVAALRGVTFEVAPGEVFALLGHNGAGKTTLMKLALGLIRPTRGGGRVLGHPLGDRQARRGIGFQPEQPYVYPFLTARETLELLGQLSGLRGPALRRRVETCAERVGLGAALDTQARRLSRGWLQRLALAGALVGDPRLLLLDEPLSGLDPQARWQVKELVRELRAEGRTLLINSHVLPDVEQLADRVALLRGGRLVACGRLDALLARADAGREMELDAPGADALDRLAGAVRLGSGPGERGSRWLLPPLDEGAERELWRALLAEGATVRSLAPRREGLEQFYARLMGGEGSAADGAPPAPEGAGETETTGTPQRAGEAA